MAVVASLPTNTSSDVTLKIPKIYMEIQGLKPILPKTSKFFMFTVTSLHIWICISICNAVNRNRKLFRRSWMLSTNSHINFPDVLGRNHSFQTYTRLSTKTFSPVVLYTGTLGKIKVCILLFKVFIPFNRFEMNFKRWHCHTQLSQ